MKVIFKMCTGVLLLAACAKSEPVFIAEDADFAPFQTWTQYSLGMVPLAGHAAGPRFAYVKQKAPPGAKEYPVGSILVKTVQPDAIYPDWQMFAMVKRGGNFDPGAAVNWEYFILAITPDGVPFTLARGTNPIVNDAPDGFASSNYGDILANALSCNRCHGIAGTAATDHILSPQLAPGAP